MSFSSSKLHRNKSKSPQKKPSAAVSDDTLPQSSKTRHLVDAIALPHTRRGQGMRGRASYLPESLLVLPNRRQYTHLPTATHDSRDTQQNASSSTYSNYQNPDEPSTDSLSLSDDPFADNDLHVPDRMHQVYITRYESETPEMRGERLQRQRQKKERQWAKWSNVVIPSLVQLYLNILHESESLRTTSNLEYNRQCDCARKSKLSIVGVYFERKFDVYQFVGSH
jgi:hypothetical protein